ncbi:MAG: hypothetical protein K8F36_08210 [Melioribacteraceae bacterium]|nr:hypothetical protein [Melioribacteraceae bacterium]MCO6472998.1 hypothetical protein [Melioribacteraceae bacterium]MDD3559840.1 hypothetical protein [Melioribacteraceae bacterium]
MEKILARLKTNSIITLMLGILSLTWVVIDYFVIETIVKEGLTKFSLEWMLLQFSGVAVICFAVSTFITLYYSTRVVMKFKKSAKTEAALTDANKDNIDIEK